MSMLEPEVSGWLYAAGLGTEQPNMEAKDGRFAL